MTLDDELVSRSLFHPRHERQDCSPRGVPTQTQCSGALVCGYLHESRASDTLLLFFHGNGEIAADYDSLSSIYTGCGVSYWAVDYRGYGRSTGLPSFSHMIRDSEMVLDDVPRLAQSVGREFRRIIVMGRSLGSASAIHLASMRSDSLNGLILDSPYANGLALIQRLGGPALCRQDLRDFQDNSDKMCRCRLPTLIIHGTDDRIIPIADAEALYAACSSTEKEIVKIKGAGHNNLLGVGFHEYCGTLKKYIARAAAG